MKRLVFPFNSAIDKLYIVKKANNFGDKNAVKEYVDMRACGAVSSSGQYFGYDKRFSCPQSHSSSLEKIPIDYIGCQGKGAIILEKHSNNLISNLGPGPWSYNTSKLDAGVNYSFS
jgi:hypothetical protein